jgi:hypothetical protein
MRFNEHYINSYRHEELNRGSFEFVRNEIPLMKRSTADSPVQLTDPSIGGATTTAAHPGQTHTHTHTQFI